MVVTESKDLAWHTFECSAWTDFSFHGTFVRRPDLKLFVSKKFTYLCWHGCPQLYQSHFTTVSDVGSNNSTPLAWQLAITVVARLFDLLNLRLISISVSMSTCLDCLVVFPDKAMGAVEKSPSQSVWAQEDRTWAFIFSVATAELAWPWRERGWNWRNRGELEARLLDMAVSTFPFFDGLRYSIHRIETT